MPDVRLPGCRSRPLVNYLKALGLLRVVARQLAPDARARWHNDALELRSDCDLDGIIAFVLDRYVPAPVVSPWNGGSGFLRRTTSLDAILAGQEPRLEPLAQAIRTSRVVLAEHDITKKLDLEDKHRKAALIRALRRRLDDDAVEWLDASMILTGTAVGHPPLLGSGGNDGNFDFADNYAQAVLTVISDPATRESSAHLITGALTAQSVTLERGRTFAHFRQEASPVASPRGDSPTLGNPWDLVLAVEGALVLQAGSSRRLGSAVRPDLAAPFTAWTTAAGYGSAAGSETGRAELWLPLWRAWASLGELESLVREARAQIGRRSARSGLDFARAAGELGVARGIDAFERYSLLERAGRMHIAVPAGRVSVAPRPAAMAIRSLDAWLDRLLSFARGSCPQSPRRAIEGLERNVFELANRGSAHDALAVIEQLGAVETALSRSARRAIDAGLRPLRSVPASPWVAVADDGSAEFSVAVSLASLRDRRGGLPAFRDYLHGTSAERSGGRVYDPGAKTRIALVSGHAGRLAALHARRHVDAERADDGNRGTPPSLRFDLGLAAHPDSGRLFADGVLDDARILRLVEGLSLFDFRGAEVPSRPRPLSVAPTPAFDLLRLAWWGSPEIELRPRAGWASRLAAGSIEPVLREALLRLRLAGLPPIPSPDDLAAQRLDGRRLAAALLLRPSIAERGDIARRLTLPSTLSAAPNPPEEKDDRAA